jgi:hypothetical protein
VKRLSLAVLGVALGSLLGCGGAVTPAPAPPVAPPPAPSAKLCGEWVLSSHGLICQRPLSADEQAHRGVAYRLWYRGSLVERLERINGRGFPEPDDNGCSERRYRFEAGYLAENTGYRPDGSVCDRALFTEQARRVRFVDAWGRPDYRTDRAYTAALYERDADGVVTKTRPLASDGTPSTINGAAEMRYEHDAQHFETRACAFDANGKPMLNYSGVHCYSHERDAAGNDVRQASWGVDGQPAAAADRSQTTLRTFDRYGNLLEVTRLGVDAKPVRSFFIRCVKLAYHYDANGFRTGADCLDAAGQPTEFDQGNSKWIATPDARGRTREIRYFDRYGSPFTSSTNYARMEADHDELGHTIEQRFFLADGTPGQKEEGAAVVRHEFDAQQLEVKRSFFNARGKPQTVKGCAAYSYEYDGQRDLVRQSCLDGAGKLASSREKVSVTLWRFDSEGLLAEMRFVDASGALRDNRSGYARKVFAHDARGSDKTTRHFKADGSALPLRRFSVLWVHPPYSDGFWPAPSRAEAVDMIESARRELLAGMPWPVALTRYGDEKVTALNPGDTGYLNFESIYPVAREAIESLQVGEYSRVVEMPFGLALYLRTE